MFCCCTGLREREATNAIHNIDFQNHVIRILDEDTKTKKHESEIPFLPEFISESDTELLKTLKYYSVQSCFLKLFRKLSVYATVHSFRVPFISVCNCIGINMLQIKEWARHTDIKMTMNICAKLLKHSTSPILEYLRKLK